MHRATSSTSSTASSSSHRSKRQFTREQLLKSLEILGPSGNPLPGDLPSPPASRSNSPVPGTKRRLPPDFEQGHSKKSRKSSVSTNPRSSSSFPSSSHPPPSRPPPYGVRSDTAEDGELREEPAPQRDTVSTLSIVPVRRPRRRERPNPAYFDEIHDRYHQFGRQFKYSGDTRLFSTYPETQKEFRSLANPPPIGSPYHQHGSLFARLELVDALVCFTYSMWCKEYARKTCNPHTWQTQSAFLHWCRSKWADAADERERVFVGLIWMIEGFIYGRQFLYATKSLDQRHEQMQQMLRRAQEEKRRVAATPPQVSIGSAGTPPMLPSPANSTPTNPRENGTPNGANGPNTSGSSVHSQNAGPPPSIPPRLKQNDPPVHVTIPVDSEYVHRSKQHSGDIIRASHCALEAQKSITLPILAKHYPRTFSRMINSSYSPQEEFEPDIEDEEGELLWPGQLSTGEGLGWLCMMGKSMIKEFGKPLGYTGLDGIIPKPRPAETPPAAIASAGPTPTPAPAYR